MEIELTGQPLRGVAPGQSVVVYRGTQVLGQATVSPRPRGGVARGPPRAAA